MEDRPKRNHIHHTAFPAPMEQHEIVSEEEWKKARAQLLEKEKALTRHIDEVVEMRRSLPWKKCSEDYQFKDLEGNAVSLFGLFKDPSLNTLIIQHFMMGPNSEKGCPSCSFWSHGFNGYLPYLQLRVNFVVCAKQSHEKLKAYYNSQHWNFPCVSSAENSFNRDFSAEALNGTGYMDGQYPGVSVFVKAEDETIYHTYSTFGRGLDLLNGVHQLLDVTPFGRQNLNESLHQCCDGWRPF